MNSRDGNLDRPGFYLTRSPGAACESSDGNARYVNVPRREGRFLINLPSRCIQEMMGFNTNLWITSE